ncbi:MAG: c-type cytochrome [Pirellulales bacterium]|nr:c-type cytochrome [Pirellulales bacterium]
MKLLTAAIFLGAFCVSFLVVPFARSADAPGGLADQPPVIAASHVGKKSAPSDSFQTLPGYRVERLLTVPKEEMGSWVCLAVDNKGRLLASDQGDKGIYRVTPVPVGGGGVTQVERLDLPLSSAQGMLYAFDSLYVSVNAVSASISDSIEWRKDVAQDKWLQFPGTEEALKQSLVSGLYRATDTDGDDQFDALVRLRGLCGPGGEHGPHALRLSPDGKSIFILCGNHTLPPFDPEQAKNDSRFGGYTPLNWSEDLLLPRDWDANGHARGILAPGGWIAETDPDGKAWKMFSIGHRNPYDMAFNSEGELFTYDADMEWDYGAPWYRPTRVIHATSGSEFGWRSGTGKWPAYYIDSLPPVLNTGPGSPVGIAFGYGAHFPARYQQALFICDWTYGTIYAIHLHPSGASYQAVKEEFLSRQGLPLTDLVIGRDGAMYFTVGGRNTQSELYRVTYVGNDSTAPAEAPIADDPNAKLRQLRRRLEGYHGQRIPEAGNPSQTMAEVIWPNLGHGDRFVRYAARIALEFQPVELWQDRLFAAMDPETVITAAVAMARQGDKSQLSKLLAALERLDVRSLSQSQPLELLRAYELAFIRLGKPDDATRKSLIAKFDAIYPAADDFLNRELCNLLVYLESPTVVAKTMRMIEQDAAPSAHDEYEEDLLARNSEFAQPLRLMMGNQPDRQKTHYAFALRNVKNGWTLDQRRAYFAFLRSAVRRSGGRSFEGFLRNIDREAYENASADEQQQIADAGLRPPFEALELPKPNGPGQDWTVDKIAELIETKLHGRNFNHGKKMYAAARCIVCHRFSGEGGSTGPDLTLLAGRFQPRDLTESIVDPSKVISDQYQATVIVADGKTYTGRIVGEQKDKLTMLTNPEDGTQTATISKDAIEIQKVSKVSLMPTKLLNPLNEAEVLDLMAYLLSRGNPDAPMFHGSEKRQASN